MNKSAVYTLVILMSVHVMTRMPLDEVVQLIFLGIISAALAQPILGKK